MGQDSGLGAGSPRGSRGGKLCKTLDGGDRPASDGPYEVGDFG